MIDIGPLSEDEKQLVLKDRAELAAYQAKVLKQKLCKHEKTKYVGHGHNDDAYECEECKDIIWR